MNGWAEKFNLANQDRTENIVLPCPAKVPRKPRPAQKLVLASSPVYCIVLWQPVDGLHQALSGRKSVKIFQHLSTICQSILSVPEFNMDQYGLCCHPHFLIAHSSGSGTFSTAANLPIFQGHIQEFFERHISVLGQARAACRELRTSDTFSPKLDA